MDIKPDELIHDLQLQESDVNENVASKRVIHQYLKYLKKIKFLPLKIMKTKAGDKS